MATSRVLATLKRETTKEGGTCNGSRMFKKGQLYKQKKQKRKSFGEYVNYFPPQKFSWEELKEYGIPESVLAVTSRNAAGFVFNGRLHFSDEVIKNGEINIGDELKIKLDENHKMGLDQFISSIMSSPLFDEKLISRKWIENHYKWIVWKLASYEVRYPEQFGNKALTPSSVMQQLKYRYDKEVEHAERSCLKKIYERDDIASRRMVLCVSDMLQLSGEQKEQQIELTDGWYAIKAQLDPPLTSFLNEGLIKVGTKLCIYGAELVGSDEGCAPLEAPATLQLKLFTNSTRRASWDSKLGYQPVKIGFYVPLKSLYGDGGMVGRTDLVILRKYPMQWMEKRNGRCIFRSSAGEDESARKYEERKQTKMEEIYQKIQKEYETKSSSKSRRSKLSKSMKNIKTIRNGKELYDIIRSAADPCTIESTLTSSQKELAVGYHEEVKERQQEEIRKKFDECWKEMGEEVPKFY